MKYKVNISALKSAQKILDAITIYICNRVNILMHFFDLPSVFLMRYFNNLKNRIHVNKISLCFLYIKPNGSFNSRTHKSKMRSIIHISKNTALIKSYLHRLNMTSLFFDYTTSSQSIILPLKLTTKPDAHSEQFSFSLSILKINKIRPEFFRISSDYVSMRY